MISDGQFSTGLLPHQHDNADAIATFIPSSIVSLIEFIARFMIA
jgi:hypothetical protein